MSVGTCYRGWAPHDGELADTGHWQVVLGHRIPAPNEDGVYLLKDGSMWKPDPEQPGWGTYWSKEWRGE